MFLYHQLRLMMAFLMCLHSLLPHFSMLIRRRWRQQQWLRRWGIATQTIRHWITRPGPDDGDHTGLVMASFQLIHSMFLHCSVLLLDIYTSGQRPVLIVWLNEFKSLSSSSPPESIYCSASALYIIVVLCSSLFSCPFTLPLVFRRRLFSFSIDPNLVCFIVSTS